jgi:hypothetical protein
MYIEDKIKEIRSKPEHVRERYVWIAVFICMLFVLSIWLFSFKTVFNKGNKDDSARPVQELIEESKKTIGEMPSIEDIKQENTSSAR